MASPRSSVIQFSDGQDAQSELQFQDFTLGESNAGAATLTPSGSYTNFSEAPSSADNETDDLLGAEKKDESSFWKFSYYQSFFDVDTTQVWYRIKGSIIPITGRATFLDREIRPKPDLYGPFWITATLIYIIALSSNIANYLVSAHHRTKTWSYDFHRVSLAATAIYLYAFLLPIILWGIMWYRKISNRCTLLEVLCVYGYSLAIYIPIAIFWTVINVPWLQYSFLIFGCALSGVVLLQTFWSVFRDDDKKIGAVVLCVIVFFHILLTVGLGAYFFQSVEWTDASPTNITINTLVSKAHEEVQGGNKVPRSIIDSTTKLINHLSLSDRGESFKLNFTESGRNVASNLPTEKHIVSR